MLINSQPLESEWFSHVWQTEFVHVVEIPIIMPCPAVKRQVRIPQHLRKFGDICHLVANRPDVQQYRYLYLTAKHSYVGPDNTPNRPGWHIDGYGTDDINFIWFNCVSTQVAVGEFDLSEHHDESMRQMEEQAPFLGLIDLAPTHIHKLDNTVVHRVGKPVTNQLRTFVKLTASNNKHNLLGNAHNHLFDYNWEMRKRGMERNDP